MPVWLEMSLKLTENGYIGRIHIVLHVDYTSVDHSSSLLMPHAKQDHDKYYAYG